MRFLKVLKQPVQNIENIWKYALKWTRYLISIFIVSFDLYEYVLATSLEKRKTNFPRLYSRSSLCLHYRISNILLHHQNFLPRNPDISMKWFYWNRCSNRCEHRDGRVRESKCEPFYWDINHQPRYNPRTALRRPLDFTQIVNEWKWKRGTVCHYVRLISQLSLERHIQILKCFHS